METTHIRDSIDRTVERLSADDTMGRGTLEARAVLEDGLRVRVDGPDGFEVTTDISGALGGDASGPSPASLARAALASCDATVVAMRAAQEEIDLSTLEVTVEWEYDSRGLLGMDDSAHPGPLAVRTRYRVGAEGVPAHQLVALVEWAEAHSPVGDAIRRAVDYETDIDVV